MLLNPLNQIIRWERLPNDQNRRYKAKNSKVILKGSLDDAEGKEVIGKEEEEGARPVERKKEEQIKVMKNSINIDGNIYSYFFEKFTFIKRILVFRNNIWMEDSILFPLRNVPT